MRRRTQVSKRTPPNSAKNRPAGGGADAMAKAAVAKRETTPTGNVKLTLTLFLSRETAERLTARAIREEKNLAALVGEILEEPEKKRR